MGPQIAKKKNIVEMKNTVGWLQLLDFDTTIKLQELNHVVLAKKKIDIMDQRDETDDPKINTHKFD